MNTLIRSSVVFNALFCGLLFSSFSWSSESELDSSIVERPITRIVSLRSGGKAHEAELLEKIKWSTMLEDDKGNLKTLSEYAVDPLLVNFFYTNCPTVCTSEMILLNQLNTKLQKESKKLGLKILSISLDPENDKSSVLAKYRADKGYLSDAWSLVTGEQRAMKLLRYSFNIVSIRNAQDIIDHTSRMYLIVNKGKGISVVGLSELNPDTIAQYLGGYVQLQ